MVTSVSNQFKGDRAGAQAAARELAAKILEHGREHLQPFFVARLEEAAAGKGGAGAVVFTDLESVEKLLTDLKGAWLARNKEKGYPVSIVLTGLTTDIHQCCQKAGITEHTYLQCLGPFGKRVKELPQNQDELSLITMCGHGFIARNRIRALVRRVQDGELTPAQAADDIGQPCRCGLRNKPRAEKIFARLAANAV